MNTLTLSELLSGTQQIISHWDTDGIISACLLVRALELDEDQVVLSSISASVAQLVKAIKRDNDKIAVLDLNIPERELVNNLGKVLGRKRLPELLIVDHHIWSDRSLTLLSAYARKVNALIDLTFPSTSRIIYEKLLDKSSLTEREALYVDIADDDDTFTNSYDITKKLRIILRWGSWKIRYELLRECIDNEMWFSSLEKLYREIAPKYEGELEKSAEHFELIEQGGLTICFLKPSEKVHPGDLQAFLEEKRGVSADIYLFVYKNGLSIRSSKYNVAKLAVELGGGGHPKASGVFFETEDKSPSNLKERLLGLIERLYK